MGGIGARAVPVTRMKPEHYHIGSRRLHAIHSAIGVPKRPEPRPIEIIPSLWTTFLATHGKTDRLIRIDSGPFQTPHSPAEGN